MSKGSKDFVSSLSGFGTALGPIVVGGVIKKLTEKSTNEGPSNGSDGSTINKPTESTNKDSNGSSKPTRQDSPDNPNQERERLVKSLFEEIDTYIKNMQGFQNIIREQEKLIEEVKRINAMPNSAYIPRKCHSDVPTIQNAMNLHKIESDKWRTKAKEAMNKLATEYGVRHPQMETLG